METIDFRKFMDNSWRKKPGEKLYSYTLLGGLTFKSLFTFSPEMQLAYATVLIGGSIPIILALLERDMTKKGNHEQASFVALIGKVLLPTLFGGSLICLFAYMLMFFKFI
jgi:hypothetical protein